MKQEEMLRDALEGMVRQFAYWANGETPGLWTGGLSALEDAFEALGWDDAVHPCPDLQCDEPGCREQRTCGTPTMTGYRRTCGEHQPAGLTSEQRAAWWAYQSEHRNATFSEWATETPR